MVGLMEQRLDELLEKHIGEEACFEKGAKPLFQDERNDRIFREILGIKIKDESKHTLFLGDELILGRDVRAMERGGSIRGLAPNMTGSSYFDTTLKAVELANFGKADYVLPNFTGTNLIREGSVFIPYFYRRIQ